jgi:hypothetical protein
VTSSIDGPLMHAERLLDAGSSEELLGEASAAAGASLIASTLRSVHHRPGRSVSHVHAATLRVAGHDRDVLLVTHVDTRPLPEAAFVLGRARERVAVWRFPNDPFLPGLPSAIDPRRVRELLDGLGAPEGAVRIHTRAYRPSRRAVVEIRIDGPAATGRILYLKVLSRGRARELAAVHRDLIAHLPVPRVVGVSSDQGIVALEALPGRTLRQAMVDGGVLPEPGHLVELSSRLAASNRAGRRDPRAFADAGRHVRPLARLVPDRAELIARVADGAAVTDAPVVCVHGDLHDGQLLLDDHGAVTGVLDVDGTGSGFLAHDAGSLVAHLEAVGEVWPQIATMAATYAHEVADAYRPVVGAANLARATAAAWLGLATGPHRAQDADWEQRTRARIDRAAEVLEGR